MAEKFTSNISTVINRDIQSLICLIVYEIENMNPCKLTNSREIYSQIVELKPEELNIDTIWEKLNIDESKLISKVITSVQVIVKNMTITNVGTADDWENYNVYVDDGHINVDNNVKTTVTNNVQSTVTNTVDTRVTNKPSVSLDEPIDVRVTN